MLPVPPGVDMSGRITLELIGLLRRARAAIVARSSMGL